jgi:hypothetical protein
MSLDAFLSEIRSYIESQLGYPVYSERGYETDNDKDAIVYIDDSNPWQLTKKETIINFKIAFRYRLDRLYNESDRFTESNAQDEVLNLILMLLQHAIPPGVACRHVKTQCGSDDQSRYIIESSFQAYIED